MSKERLDRIDKYEVLERVATGGMGSVYKAIHPQFKKYVAIKEIRSELSHHPDIQRRFEHEVEVLAKLPPHPHILTVRDALCWRGRLYLVMDFISGGTLRDLIEQGGLGVERCAQILEQVLSALEVIHASGVVHRDLKASNILIDPEGMAHISDFGIAELAAGTKTAPAMATAKYAAPEIFDPQLARGGDESQTDLYSMGMVAYEMLLGEPRFREVFAEIYNRAAGRESERWANWHTNFSRRAPNLNELDPGIPKPLAAVAERLMAKNVKERYLNASQARRDLAAWMWGDGQVRQRRPYLPDDDATRPLDRLRPRGGEPGRHGPSESYRQEPAYEPQAAAPRTPPRPVYRLTWWAAGGALLLLLTAALLISGLGMQRGFTLIVRGAPRGSVLYVDGKRVGVPTHEDTIRVTGLTADKARELSLMSEGTPCELKEKTVTVADGKEQFIDATCGATDLPDEIIYHGPMVLVRDEGEFPMGDDNHANDERPQHPVRIGSYYIDKFEVTNEQFKQFRQAEPGWEPLDNPKIRPFYQNNPRFPVIGVGWADAVAYAKWVGKRLPTEAEWEKAASWDQKQKRKYLFPWGDTLNESRVSFARELPASVDEFPGDVSPYGVRGMGGNASEWVADSYDRYTAASPTVADFNDGTRVVRGGSFYRKDKDQLRTTYRGHRDPNQRATNTEATAIGFRCVISANDPALQPILRDRNRNK